MISAWPMNGTVIFVVFFLIALLLWSKTWSKSSINFSQLFRVPPFQHFLFWKLVQSCFQLVYDGSEICSLLFLCRLTCCKEIYFIFSFSHSLARQIIDCCSFCFGPKLSLHKCIKSMHILRPIKTRTYNLRW